MDTPGSQEITELLAAWGGGDQAALERLIPLVYAELKRIARRHMFRESEGHMLQTTALVHEACMKLISSPGARYFGGMSMEETAAVLNLSPATALRDWNAAKAWLYRQLNRTGPQEIPGLAQ